MSRTDDTNRRYEEWKEVYRKDRTATPPPWKVGGTSIKGKVPRHEHGVVYLRAIQQQYRELDTGEIVYEPGEYRWYVGETYDLHKRYMAKELPEVLLWVSVDGYWERKALEREAIEFCLAFGLPTLNQSVPGVGIIKRDKSRREVERLLGGL